MADQEHPGFTEGARVITIERLCSDPDTGRRNRDRFQRVLVTAHAYGAYRPAPPDLHDSQFPGYDLSRLTDAERGQLEALLAKARAPEGAVLALPADPAGRRTNGAAATPANGAGASRADGVEPQRGNGVKRPPEDGPAPRRGSGARPRSLARE
jgi:hypothetical protein